MASNVSDNVSVPVASNLSDKAASNLSKNVEKKSLLDLKETGASKTLSTYLKTKMKNKKHPLVSGSWDPFLSLDWDDTGPPPFLASTRIRRDLSSLFEEPLPGIFVIPEENNFCMVHALILGPFDTPYEGGFFHFAVRFGPSYPIHPPRVRFMTTDSGKVRFNPNIYADGKVCLSILGTWSGPHWSPAQNLGSVLLSIQSILNEKPFFNEPGFTSERYFGESKSYNTTITHETIRVAVCGQLQNVLDGKAHNYGECLSPPIGEPLTYRDRSKERLPSELGNVIKDSFIDFYDCYVETCNKYKILDGQEMPDIFHGTHGNTRLYQFSVLLERLQELKERIESMPPPTDQSKEEEAAAGEKEGSLSSLSDDDDNDDGANRHQGKDSDTKSLQGSTILGKVNDFIEEYPEIASGSSSNAAHLLLQLEDDDNDDSDIQIMDE